LTGLNDKSKKVRVLSLGTGASKYSELESESDLSLHDFMAMMGEHMNDIDS